MPTRLERMLQDWVRDNQDVQEIVLRRPPKPEKPKVYDTYSAEGYGHMPETCPKVRAILEKRIPDVTVREYGDQTAEEVLRENIFQDIHDQVTVPWRYHFNEVLTQTYRLLKALERFVASMQHTIAGSQTKKPEPAQPRVAPDFPLYPGSIVVQVAEEDDL